MDDVHKAFLLDDSGRDQLEIKILQSRVAMLTNTIYRMEKVLTAAYQVSMSEDPMEMMAKLRLLAEAFEEYKK